MPSALNHRGPAQKRVLDYDVVVLRKIDPSVLGRPLHTAISKTRIGGDLLEGDQDWFLDNYVAADQPRDAGTSNAIREATIGFAIARSDNGQILATFKRNEFDKVTRVADSARVELAVNVALEAEGDADDDDGEAA